MPTLRDTIAAALAGEYTVDQFPVTEMLNRTRDELSSYNPPLRGMRFPRFEDYASDFMRRMTELSSTPPIVVDDTVPEDRVYLTHDPNRYGDGSGRIAFDAFVDHETQEQRLARHRELATRLSAEEQSPAAARPDHYRVRGGECACGYRSVFRADMESHLRDDLFDNGPGGVPRRFRLCERCGDSAACREVVTTNQSGFAFMGPAGAVEAPGPVVRAWYCDSCAVGAR